MEDLIQCPAARDDFQRWLTWGQEPMTFYNSEKADMVLLRMEKDPSVDYLYRIAVGQDSTISWNSSPTFCGVYDVDCQTLYLTGDALHSFMSGKIPFIAETGPSMRETISGRINQRVEEIIADDRNNLTVREISGWQALKSLQYYQEYGAEEEAIRQLFDGEKPDSRFHSDYTLNELPEAAFIAYIQDPEGFVQTEAEQYIRINQEKFLLQFLENDALLAEYQALTQDADNPIHKMRAITEAVKASGAKTVTVTVRKGERELTFKTAASALKGRKNYYSTYDIPASDRREFERVFGRHSDYKAEDITRITYGRTIIYEAPSVQTEEQSERMRMGGMQFG
ncbi:hypothetical protein D1646_03825 [Pseudoflavonifractor sp. 60]|uniref:hypothetical protein n=1 Tax=Pseudoflavonifractor sp. 60 TaxID=2304576 RepID=UPI00136B8070|nr:hypothetical protein [Pseudoflavonifractor sp. 60]NBI65952.1 hypothetical protein [Pseudoflavonifractor sp. 60]